MSLFANYGVINEAGELELKYYGTIGDVAGAGNYPKALSFASKILYNYGSETSFAMYSLSENFTRTALAVLPNTVYKGSGINCMSGGVLTSRAIIGSGTERSRDEGTTYYNSRSKIYSYNTSLTRSSLADLSGYTYSYPRRPSDAAATSDHVIFVVNDKTIHYQPYNNSGTKLTEISSSYRYWTSATTSFLGQGVFAGGEFINTSGTTTVAVQVYYFNDTLTKSTASMAAGREYGAASATNKHLLIGGGATLNTPYSSVEVFNDSFVRQTGLDLGIANKEPVATTLGENIIFITNDKRVTIFNSNLVKVPMSGVVTAPCFNGATTLNNYAVFLTPSPSIAEVFELS